jgi:hypothetical protein
MERIEKLIPLLAPILATVLGALGIFLQDWWRKRDDRFRRKQARTEAIETVTFIEKWIKTQELTCSAEEFAQAKLAAHQQLEKLYASLMYVQQIKPAPTQERSFIRRALLLYSPPTIGALFIHMFFYFWIGVFLLWTFGLGWAAVTDKTAPKGTLVVITIIGLILLIPLFPLRAWAIWLGNRRRRELIAEIFLAHNSPVDVDFVGRYR